MLMLRLYRLVLLLGFFLGLATSSQAAWPERTVTLVVPYAAGGLSDLQARVAAEWLHGKFKSPFIVENVPGGAGIVATGRVARAAPDGYTLLSATISQFAIIPFISKTSYDPIKDFKPISIYATSPFVITVDKSLPVNTLAEFIAYAKARPGKLNYGAAGAGSLSHISAAAFLKRAGLEMTMVPYKGLAPALVGLLAGDVHMVSATPVELKPVLDKVKMLGTSGPTRSPLLPEVPAIAETFPGHSVVTWNGVLAPAGTPQPVIDALAEAIIDAQKTPQFRDRLEKLGVEPAIMTPEQFARMIAADTERWRKLIPQMGLALQQ